MFISLPVYEFHEYTLDTDSYEKNNSSQANPLADNSSKLNRSRSHIDEVLRLNWKSIYHKQGNQDTFRYLM